MLLDRRRINRWAKWVALFLAIVFALGFLFMGVGYGGAGFNLSEIFTGGDSSSQGTQTPQERIAAYEATLAQNPSDMDALLGIAAIFQQNDQFAEAAVYLERALAVEPNQKDLYIRLANLYLNANVADYSKAVAVLNKATTVDPDNPDVYLKLGTAQNSLGRSEAAILAWQKYLQLAPNGSMADVVRQQIESMSKRAVTDATTAATTDTTTATDPGTSVTTASTTP